MAVHFAVSSAERRIGFGFLRHMTVATDIRRGAVDNAAASVTVQDSHRKLKTVADLPEIKTFRMLYTLIFKGYLNRMHELQVQRDTTAIFLLLLRISSILFETRIGCLEKEIPAETQNFINSIAQMFTYSMPVVFLPNWTRNYLPFWQWYINGWEGIFKFGKKMIDMKMEAIQKRLDANQEVAGEYLTYLLSNVKMSSKDVYGNISELLLAGVNTTSNTMLWALYLLSRDPEAQEALYQDVTRVLKGDGIPTAQEVNSMPYLKAVMKETLRMYPVVPMNSRLIAENDVVIGGHFFPKKTTFTLCHYAISHDKKVFPEPQKFKPDRWLRDGRTRPNPFGSIPFGYGVRGCVGRRIAELEMHLALARLIKLFEIRPDPTVGEVRSLNRTVLVPDRQVNLHFVERQKTSSEQ
uniref:Cytochrome P450 family 27 subfamily A member 1 n=1 Tax=Sinocyclocheilus grahami TaxID=75366 RepID=A0A672KAG4_SINGR